MNRHWHNGSLREQIWTNHTLPLPEANNVNLTRLSDGLASLAFSLTSTQSLHPTFALANTLLSSDFYSRTVQCTYPISGTYSFSSRILFYILLLFALLWRRHGWLAVAALATAMTYSATTAIHALALLSQFGWTSGALNLKSSQPFGDLDILATYLILTASLVMMTPILNWSTTVRRDKAQIIVILWGILTLVAYGPVIIYVTEIPKGFRHWDLNPIMSLLMCPWSATQTFPACGPDMDLTVDAYDKCQCFDFCGVIVSPAPMRSGAKMVPSLYGGGLSIAAWRNSALLGIVFFSQVMAAIIVIYGCFGLLLHQFSLREVRDLIFRVCDAHSREHEAIWFSVLTSKLRSLFHIPNQEIRVMTYTTETTRSFSRKAQYWFAKILAMTFYSIGLLLAFICPFVFVTVLTVLELSTISYPISENSDAVGAWSPWVGAAFIILVAAILRLQDAWELAFMSIGKKLLSSMGIGGFTTQIQERESRQGGEIWGHFIGYLLFRLWSSMDHARYSIYISLNTTVFICQEFWHWIGSPIPHPYTCGCKGCIAHRKLERAARIPRDQVDQSACQSCMIIDNQTIEIFRRHKITGKPCGCRVCWSARQQALDTTMRKKMEKVQQARQDKKSRRKKQFRRGDGIEPVLEATDVLEQGGDYKTLGIRILQMFAAGIDDRLSEPDSKHHFGCSAASVHSGNADSTASALAHMPNSQASRNSTALIRPGDGDGATSVDIPSLLLNQAAVPGSDLYSPVSTNGDIELSSMQPKEMNGMAGPDLP